MTRPDDHSQCASTMQGLRNALLVVHGKWKLQILVALQSGTRHFRGLERTVPGISTKVLAKELKDLEAHKLIARTVHPGPPVLVEYESTDYCKTFGPLILTMIKWGIEHRERIKQR